MDEKNLRRFCAPLYESKDIMHSLCHIDRISALAKNMHAKHIDADKQTIIFGAYFHGLVENNADAIAEYLKSINVPEDRMRKILQASLESLVHSIPMSLEGKILHDAHLLEGGKTFIVTKCLVPGTVRGQGLVETIRYIEKNIIGKGKVSLEENREEYEEMQLFAKDYLRDLKSELGL